MGLREDELTKFEDSPIGPSLFASERLYRWSALSHSRGSAGAALTWTKAVMKNLRQNVAIKGFRLKNRNPIQVQSSLKSRS